jgi:hypothetical protein
MKVLDLTEKLERKKELDQLDADLKERVERLNRLMAEITKATK